MAKNERPPSISYWSLVEPVWLPLNRTWDEGCKEFVGLFQAIRAEIGNLYACHWCHCEVCNGGFYQFFSNTTGILAPEAQAGFRAIGLSELAGVVAKAMVFFGDSYPREREKRLNVLPERQKRNREVWDPFYNLDKEFYEYTDCWEAAADEYTARFE
jgi:hypothetical protein